jgi:AraC family transcriptional regulator
MEIAIKNMVCSRCIKVVKQILDELKIRYASVELGLIKIKEEVGAAKYDRLKTLLEAEGFALIENDKHATVEQIKNAIIDLVYNKDLSDFNINLSTYLSHELHKDYSSISQLFSSIENTTIEQYFILQKLELVKEMLVYDHLPLSEIAWKMGYSSVSHLSAQFKKITGFTPSQFKNLKEHKKQLIDKI